METTKTVSSPAIVPIAECNLPDLLALSKLPAKNAAALANKNTSHTKELDEKVNEIEKLKRDLIEQMT